MRPQRTKDSKSIWFKRKELRKSLRFSTVLIDKDLSPESARERAKLRGAYKKAKDLNIDKVFIKGKNLIINSSKYSVNNLPEYLLVHWDGNNNWLATFLWKKSLLQLYFVFVKLKIDWAFSSTTKLSYRVLLFLL